MLVDEYKAFIPEKELREVSEPVDAKVKTTAITKKNGAIQVHAMASLVAGAACVMLYWRNNNYES